MPSPFILGVTGSIGAGKSAVLNILAGHGFEIIDADSVYHRLIAAGGPLVAPIRAEFGPDVVAVDGSIDRSALRAVVFADPAALKRLDEITHPVVIAAIERRIADTAQDRVAVDGIKLVESGMADRCDRVWLITAADGVRRERLMKRNRLSAAEADARIAASPDPTVARARADVVLDNSRTLADLEKAIAHQLQIDPILSK
jgi:dephospho-CoA kinase